MAPNARPDILTCGDAERDAWDSYVAVHPDASVYHLWSWRDIIRETFDRETYYLMARRQDQICGVLPLVRLKSFVFGDFLVSMPYLSYGGVIADSQDDALCLIEAGNVLGQQLGVRHVEYRHLADFESLPKRTDKVSMQLELYGDSEEQWKRLGAKRRSQIKRPLREGVEAVQGGEELLADFYSVFALKYRQLGVPVYPLSWFQAILQKFPDKTSVFVVYMRGKPVAASIVIGYQGVLEVPWAASLRYADKFSVNMYLYWTMIKYAEESGFRVFDFGRSSEGSGTWRFKKQWGAAQKQLYWHYWLDRGDELPQLNAANPRYKSAVRAWRHLPLWMTRVIGPQIVKNLP